MPWRPSRVGIAQSNVSMPELDAADEVVDRRRCPSRWRGRVAPAARSIAQPTTSYICALSAPERAADRDARRGARRRPPAPTRAAGPRRRRPARSRRRAGPRGRGASCQSRQRSQPAVRALGRARGVVARRRGTACTRRRRARCPSRARPGPPSRSRAPMKRSRAVDVGAEAHALLLDREDRAVRARRRRRAALDLVGDGAVAHREDLEAAGVGDDRRRPSA